MDEPYSERLLRLQTAPWKRWLDVQRPYRANLRSLEPGFVLDVGCGIGRNLRHVGGRGVGVDLDADAVAYVRDTLGFRAYTTTDFPSSPDAVAGRFDSLLLSHVLEHVDAATAATIVTTYLPFVRDGGRVLVITPQERGHASDATHVRFFDEAACERLARDAGLVVERAYSFPFPRPVGRVFVYNEFVFALRRAR